MAEICRWTQDTLKIAIISCPEIYHTTMSQKLQITRKSNKIISVCRGVLFEFKGIDFFFKCWRHHFCKWRNFDAKISNFQTRITRMVYEEVRHFSLMENVKCKPNYLNKNFAF